MVGSMVGKTVKRVLGPSDDDNDRGGSWCLEFTDGSRAYFTAITIGWVDCTLVESRKERP
jgi:hypothetical protein